VIPLLLPLMRGRKMDHVHILFRVGLPADFVPACIPDNAGAASLSFCSNVCPMYICVVAARKKRLQEFVLGVLVGIVLAVTLIPLALDYSWYLGVIVVLAVGLTLTLLLVAMLGGKRE